MSEEQLDVALEAALWMEKFADSPADREEAKVIVKRLLVELQMWRAKCN